MPRRFFLPLMALLLSLAACDEHNKKAARDTLSSGTIAVSADETYKPAIEKQLYVFRSSYPEAHINITYKPESECIKDFLAGKTRVILVTRELNAAEKKYCEEAKIPITSQPIARDGVAVIVNPAATDTALTLAQLQSILTGQYGTRYTVVFDNEGSSTVRFVTDSILKGSTLGTNVFAAKGAAEAVDYVSKNRDAIGFMGQSYLYNDKDTGSNLISSVKMVKMQSPEDGFVPPTQMYVAMRAWPLTRNLYYIHRDAYMGLGTGFSNFLAQDRGQLIFKGAHLFPLRKDVIMRPAELKGNSPTR